jgi:hypothetical protein
MCPHPWRQDAQQAFPPVRGLWWACQDLNLGPHPYQQNTGDRCADGRFPRSRPTVDGEVICCHRVLLCALILRPISPQLESIQHSMREHDVAWHQIASFMHAAGDPAMAIGGSIGSDPSPKPSSSSTWPRGLDPLAPRRRPGDAGRQWQQPRQQIAAVVTDSFTASTVGGATVYDHDHSDFDLIPQAGRVRHPAVPGCRTRPRAEHLTSQTRSGSSRSPIMLHRVCCRSAAATARSR